MYSSKKIFLTTIGIAILVVLLSGVTFAFFNYTRTGASNTIKVGKISFITNQTDTISLNNLFPIDPTETGVMEDTTKVGTLVIDIEGDTDYADGVEYLISVTNAHINTNEGKVVPISIDVDIDTLGTPSDNYFTARNAKDATIYKRLSGDVVSSNQMLLVGYIKKNTTTGQAEGVDGSITIKAYLDKNKILISDTYDGTESEINGTTNSMAQGKTVISTSEWNSLQTNGLSFQVKVEANEGIWVSEPIYNRLRTEAVMDNISSTNVSSNTGIDFSKISGDTDADNVLDNGQGLYIRKGTENDTYPVVYYRGDVDNNVYFAGHCWQMVRTTETGGVKMIYNGENTGSSSTPACNNTTGISRQITLNIAGVDNNTFYYSGGGFYKGIGYYGYTYKGNNQGKQALYPLNNGNYETGSKFGNSVIWDGTNYTITDVSDTINEYHHYTCGTTGTTTCSTIRYYYSYYTISSTYYYYYSLTGGKTIEDIVKESLENGTVESTAKEMVEKWYEENIDDVSNAKIEDTVYCDDRSIYQLGSLNPNGGTLNNNFTTQIVQGPYARNRGGFNPNPKCLRNIDSFTKSNTIGNGLLDYPVGLITADEVTMAGGSFPKNNSHYYLFTGADYYTMTPVYSTTDGNAVMFYVYETGSIATSVGSFKLGLRPVISLAPSLSIVSGSGTNASPYIVN